jgi:hypothetical protein
VRVLAYQRLVTLDASALGLVRGIPCVVPVAFPAQGVDWTTVAPTVVQSATSVATTTVTAVERKSADLVWVTQTTNGYGDLAFDVKIGSSFTTVTIAGSEIADVPSWVRVDGELVAARATALTLVKERRAPMGTEVTFQATDITASKVGAVGAATPFQATLAAGKGAPQTFSKVTLERPQMWKKEYASVPVAVSRGISLPATFGIVVLGGGAKATVAKATNRKVVFEPSEPTPAGASVSNAKFTYDAGQTVAAAATIANGNVELVFDASTLGSKVLSAEFEVNFSGRTRKYAIAACVEVHGTVTAWPTTFTFVSTLGTPYLVSDQETVKLTVTGQDTELIPTSVRSVTVDGEEADSTSTATSITFGCARKSSQPTIVVRFVDGNTGSTQLSAAQVYVKPSLKSTKLLVKHKDGPYKAIAACVGDTVR